MNNFTLKPEMFIMGPYSRCNFCLTNNLGVVKISGNTLLQRCKKCFQDKSTNFPDIKKKIIYLDQFTISNLMKCVNLEHMANNKNDLLVSIITRINI